MNNKVVTKTSTEFGSVRCVEEKGSVVYCASDVAKALGYSNSRKAIIDHCRCVTKRDIPHPQSPSKQLEVSFIPEADVYRLICHSKLPSAMAFEKWVFEDVVPKAVHGNVKQPDTEQLTLETAEYHYFDKTLYGEPVLTAADVEHFTGVGTFQTEYYLKRYAAKNTDYAIIGGKTLVQYKEENPGVNKLASAVFVVMKSGFVKLMKYFGCGAATPECFLKSSITENEKKPDKEKYALIVGNSRVVRLMDMINKRITAIEVTMDLMYKHNVEVGKMDALRKTLNELSFDLSAEISALTYEKLGTTEKYMY